MRTNKASKGGAKTKGGKKGSGKKGGKGDKKGGKGGKGKGGRGAGKPADKCDLDDDMDSYFGNNKTRSPHITMSFL